MKANRQMNDDEPAASLTGGARSDALHALSVLAETAETSAAGESDTPPLPDHLRDQWQETYGESAPAPAAVTAAGVRGREGWLSRLSGFFTKPRAAWAGGLLAAAAAVVVLIMQQPEPVNPGPGGGPVVTRGGGTLETGTAARLIVVGTADATAPLVAELKRAFPARDIERVDHAPPAGAGEAIIIDPAAGTVRRGQGASAQVTGDRPVSAAAVIMAVEGLDEPEPR